MTTITRVLLGASVAFTGMSGYAHANDDLVRGIIGLGTAIIVNEANRNSRPVYRERYPTTREYRRQHTRQPTMEELEARENRRSVQRSLNALGFNAGSPDGVYGPRTRAAISAFQSSIGHVPTGRISQEQVVILHHRSNGGGAFASQQNGFPAPGGAAGQPGGGFPPVAGGPSQPPATGFPALAGAQNPNAATGFPALNAGSNAGSAQDMPVFVTPGDGTASASAGAFPALAAPSGGAAATAFPAFGAPAAGDASPAAMPTITTEAAAGQDPAMPALALAAADPSGDALPELAAPVEPSAGASPDIGLAAPNTDEPTAALRNLGTELGKTAFDLESQPSVIGVVLGQDFTDALEQLTADAFENCAMPEGVQVAHCSRHNETMGDELALYGMSQAGVWAITRSIAFRTPVPIGALNERFAATYPKLMEQSGSSKSISSEPICSGGKAANGDLTRAINLIGRAIANPAEELHPEALEFSYRCPIVYSLEFAGSGGMVSVVNITFVDATVVDQIAGQRKEQETKQVDAVSNDLRL